MEMKRTIESIGKATKKMVGLMETKHFGAKRRARHSAAKTKFLKKMRGESTMPF